MQRGCRCKCRHQCKIAFESISFDEIQKSMHYKPTTNTSASYLNILLIFINLECILVSLNHIQIFKQRRETCGHWSRKFLGNFSDKLRIIVELLIFQFAEILNFKETWPLKVLNFSHELFHQDFAPAYKLNCNSFELYYMHQGSEG